MPEAAVVKGDQWVLLSRPHAQALLALPPRILAPEPSSSSSSSAYDGRDGRSGGQKGSDENGALLKALFRQVVTRLCTEPSFSHAPSPPFY